MKLIAHRGASKEAPENTLASIHKALEIGVDLIEIDVHLTKDNVPVVIHDAILGKTTNNTLQERITHLTWAQVQQLDVGSWFGEAFAGEKIPSLEQVLAIDRGSTGLMIEIKKGHSSVKPLVSAVLDLVFKYKSPHYVIGSFSYHIVEELKKRWPECPICGIVEDFNMVSTFKEMNLPRVVLWHKLANPELIQSFHQENAEVWVYTVDDHAAEALASFGVDGLITNDPRNLKALTCFK